MPALAELLPGAKSLSRVDKLQLIQMLAQDLARDEDSSVPDGRSYEVWSPDTAFDAADVMLRALDADRAKK